MRIVARLAVVLMLVICGSTTLWADQRGRGKGNGQGRGQVAHGDDRARYFEKHGHTNLRIPPGHYPRPGQCRIWYPGRPPGHQPPAGDCGRLSARVPPGAWLIRHPADDHEHVHVVVYDEHRPGSIFVTGQFKIADGVFVGLVIDR